MVLFDLDRFATCLTDARLALGLTQEELGARLGVRRHTVASWEGASTTPSIDTLCRVCDAVGIDPRWFFRA